MRGYKPEVERFHPKIPRGILDVTFNEVLRESPKPKLNNLGLRHF